MSISPVSQLPGHVADIPTLEHAGLEICIHHQSIGMTMSVSMPKYLTSSHYVTFIAAPNVINIIVTFTVAPNVTMTEQE